MSLRDFSAVCGRILTKQLEILFKYQFHENGDIHIEVAAREVDHASCDISAEWHQNKHSVENGMENMKY